MQSGIYVGISGQIALQRRLETIANNVANASTAGFREEKVKFDQELSRVPPIPTAFVSANETFLSRRHGAVTRTNNPLDVAVQGEAWLSVLQNGQQVYTRNGAMVMAPDGTLQNSGGDPYVDVGGAPIVLNPNAGPPQISRDGAIFQNGERQGALGLFLIEDEAKLSRAADASVLPDRPALPALDFAEVGVLQGFVEESNVNAVLSMTHLIEVHRRFDAVTNWLTTADQTQQRIIRELGPTTA